MAAPGSNERGDHERCDEARKDRHKWGLAAPQHNESQPEISALHKDYLPEPVANPFSAATDTKQDWNSDNDAHEDQELLVGRGGHLDACSLGLRPSAKH